MSQYVPLHRKSPSPARMARSGALGLAWATLLAAPWYIPPALRAMSVPGPEARLVALAISAASVIAMAAYRTLRLLRARRRPPPLHAAHPGRLLELGAGAAASQQAKAS